MRRAAGLIALALTACNAELPDPESTGARVMRNRCGGCHVVMAPGSMTVAMWDMQLGRMRRLFDQQGIPWLGAADETALRAYLAEHAAK